MEVSYMEPSTTAPPPWALTGEGIVLLYHNPKEFNRQYGFMAGYQQTGYKGLIGAVILADYKSSNVGSYRELMYIPGLFYIGGKLTFSISKIFVSSFDSLWNGRQNWGIPKELAEFQKEVWPDGTQVYKVNLDGQTIFDVRVKPWGPGLPFWSNLVPYTRITQQLQSKLLLTQIVASGHARMASLKHATAAQEFFPPVQLLKHLLVLSLSDFRMAFPVPKVLR